MNANKPLLKKLGIILGIIVCVATIAVGIYLLRGPGQEATADETTATQVTTTKVQVPQADIDQFMQEMISYGKAKGLTHYDPDGFYDYYRNPEGEKRERNSVQFPYALEKILVKENWAKAVEGVFADTEAYMLNSNKKPLPYFSASYDEDNVYLHRDWVSAFEG